MSSYNSPIGGIVGGNYSWQTTDIEGYSSVSFNITIHQQATAFFWAHQFWFVNGDGGYIGLQTDGSFKGQKTKIVIFSIWKALEAEAADEGIAQTFGGEGEGFNCAIPLEWCENQLYKLTIKNIEKGWWEAIISDSSGADNLIGKIRVPDSWKKMQSNTACFVEGFGQQDGSLKPCSEVPYTKALFGCPLMEETQKPSTMQFQTYGKCKDAGTDVGKAYNGEDEFNFYAETGIE